jgi:hypothetical protein
MNVPDDADHVFQELALPHVDGALAELSESDRDAVILRFLQQRSFRDVAQALGSPRKPPRNVSAARSKDCEGCSRGGASRFRRHAGRRLIADARHSRALPRCPRP